jgi:hypothetical protein
MTVRVKAPRFLRCYLCGDRIKNPNPHPCGTPGLGVEAGCLSMLFSQPPSQTRGLQRPDFAAVVPDPAYQLGCDGHALLDDDAALLELFHPPVLALVCFAHSAAGIGGEMQHQVLRRFGGIAQDAPGQVQVVVDFEVFGEVVVVFEDSWLLNTLTKDRQDGQDDSRKVGFGRNSLLCREFPGHARFLGALLVGRGVLRLRA